MRFFTLSKEHLASSLVWWSTILSVRQKVREESSTDESTPFHLPVDTSDNALMKTNLIHSICYTLNIGSLAVEPEY
jgi:hypothetical protein